jgi:UDP-N-acetylmuramoylalanine--D-glutamate ligase
MKIAIVGWGIEGQSAFNYFGPEHEYLIVNEQPLSNFPQESDKIKIQYLHEEKPTGTTGNVKDFSYLKGLEECDKIVYTPTARKNLEEAFKDTPGFWKKATSAVAIFLETSKSKNIIGVTGTKGKGTTSMLIYRFLEAAGKKSYLGGNIGRSVLDFLNDVQEDDYVVLELSNFQLYRLMHSPHIGVCLILAPEHLDWHPDMEDYLDAKANLFAHQSAQDIAIYYDSNQYSRQLAYRSPGIKIPYFLAPGARIRDDGNVVIGTPEVEIIHKDEIKMLGKHNLQNICAAITAFWQASQDINAIKQVLITFAGLENRLEFVRETDGIKFYNDSFAAAPGAAGAAIDTILDPKIVILGGFDRLLPLDELTKQISSHSHGIRKLVLIGQSAKRLGEELEKEGYDNFEITRAQTMGEIVKVARSFAKSGDSVVLSPGFPSFDMFKNFDDRGQKFKEAVYAL